MLAFSLLVLSLANKITPLLIDKLENTFRVFNSLCPDGLKIKIIHYLFLFKGPNHAAEVGAGDLGFHQQ